MRCGSGGQTNGVFVGNTPLRFPVANGKHRVRLSMPGYYRWEQNVMTYSGFNLSVTLESTKK